MDADERELTLKLPGALVDEMSAYLDRRDAGDFGWLVRRSLRLLLDEEKDQPRRMKTPKRRAPIIRITLKR